MKTLLAFFLSLFIFSSAQASVQMTPRWALEKNLTAEGTGNAERLYGMGFLLPLGESEAMKIKLEGGGWISRQADRESSWYASAAWGYRAQMLFGLFFEAFVGPAVISRPDSRLGGRFQIKHDLAMGWADKDGWGIAGEFSHLSCAGLCSPNMGRDFLGLKFLIPLH